ncbi:MAG: rhiC, partial [Verrucomicrobiales bacterium]|nr:rhiC [Verrucomicrobiales bacterium]
MLRLVETLKRRSDPDWLIDFYILTIDGDPPAGEVAQPVGGGITGLAYAIAQTNHQFKVRNIDLASEDFQNPGALDELIERIQNEESSDRGSAVKLSGGIRYEKLFSKLDWGGFKNQTGLRTGGVYIILGGSGSVGGVVTRCLIEKYQASVVWIGRRPGTAPELQARLASYDALGHRPLYIQADATDFEALSGAVRSIKQQFRQIHGVIFAGVVSFGFDDSISRIREEDFQRQIETKTIGGSSLFRAFREESIDFMCFFSSIQSFSFLSSRNSASYAAAITGGDSVVRALASNSRFPVGLIHWSYWKNSVAGTPLEKSIHGHFGVLEDGKAFEFFENYTAALRSGIVSPLICMRASDSVHELMGLTSGEQRSFPTRSLPSVFAAISKRRFDDQPAIDSLLSNNPWKEIDLWLAKLLFVQIQSMGVFTYADKHKDKEAWRNTARIIHKYQSWWESCCLPTLVEGGFLTEKSGELALSAVCRIESATVWSEWNTRKEFYKSNVDARAGVILAENCLRNLPAILRGEVPATSIVFPESSMHSVENMYQGNALADLFNATAAKIISAFIEERVKADPDVRIRLIEIGAGTGATTAAIFQAIKPWKSLIDRYDYTDISKAFLIHASDRFGKEFPFLKTGICNIEKPPSEQHFDLGTYDILIATNVLHATSDIRRTLTHVKSLLKRNGLLILNEGIEKGLLGSLTFGLLDGWWLYADDARRIPGSPLLDVSSWKRILAEVGFAKVFRPLEQAEATGQQLFICESDGVISTFSDEPVAPRYATVKPATSENAVDQPDLMGHVSEVILKHAAQTLRASPENIDRNVPFSDYGMDSILGVGFIGLINKDLGLSLNAAVIFDHSSVNRLAKHVLKTCGKGLQYLTRSSAKAAQLHQTSNSVASKSEPLSGISEIRGVEMQSSKIAVIGISGQFPGAVNVTEFWENLLGGRDGVESLTGPYLGENSGDPNAYTWGGILNERDCFYSLFFKISPREAEGMHCHQRLVLQECWKGLE